MGASASIQRKNKFEVDKEQPKRPNTSIRDREFYERSYQSLSSSEQHNEKTKQVGDSSDSEAERITVRKAFFFGVHSL